MMCTSLTSADAVDTAIESLVTQLPEEAKPVLNQSDQIKEPVCTFNTLLLLPIVIIPLLPQAGREGCVGEERWQQVRHRVEHFADQAIESECTSVVREVPHHSPLPPPPLPPLFSLPPPPLPPLSPSSPSSPSLLPLLSLLSGQSW